VSVPRWLRFREAGLLLVLLFLLAIMPFLAPRFFHPLSLSHLVRHYAEIGIMASAMTLVILTGGIDLSVASTLALSGVLFGFSTYFWGWPVAVAALLALGTGLAAGLFNGFLITFARVPPLIVTLATWTGYRGLALAIGRDRAASTIPDPVIFLGQGSILGIPAQMFVLLLVAIASAAVLHATPLGRGIYAVGGNEKAARFAAVPTHRIKMFVYAWSGVCAALAAMVVTGRSGSVRADIASGYELKVIACVVVGGTSIQGGRGSIGGTILGLCIIAVLIKGLGVAGYGGQTQDTVLGIVFIATALIHAFLERLQRAAQ
jgi:ribose/xylose/arabinose/galactoside ABC-type transport system permease subunit